MIKITDVWSPNFNLFVDDIVNNIQSINMVILDCLHEVDHYDKVFNKHDIDRLLNVTTFSFKLPSRIDFGKG